MPTAEPRWQRFTKALAGSLDGEQIADLLWMAPLLAAELGVEPAPLAEAVDSRLANVEKPRAGGSAVADSADSGVSAPAEDSEGHGTTTPGALVVPMTGAEPPPATTPRVTVAEAGLLPRPRRIGRALAPLNRRLATGPARHLDVAATVEAIARARLDRTPWQPVLRPRREPWLALHLLFDDHASMALWQRLRRELPRILGREARWRDLRRWSLSRSADGPMELRGGHGRRCAPRRLRRPGGRDLILVVSDTIAPAWRDGAMAELLHTWAAHQPVVAMQVLPSRLWPRTGLGPQEAGWVQARQPMSANPRLRWQPFDTDPFALEDVPTAPPRGTLTLPLTTLEPRDLGAMARLLSGTAGNSLRGFRFEPPATDSPPAAPGPPLELDSDAIEQQLALFLFTASPLARRLLALLTFAPVITLPVVRLIQRRQVADGGPAQVAEVLFSGLFRNSAAAPSPRAGGSSVPVDRQRLAFVDEALRPRLREGMRVGEARAVFEAVSEHVAASLNRGVESFEALLRAPTEARDDDERELLRAFATVAPSCLRGLGHRYEELAEAIETAWSRDRADSPPPMDADLEVLRFETAWLEEIELAPLDFETATLSRNGVITRRSGQAWGFVESLVPKRAAGPSLTLVEIPASTFEMGSAANEPGSVDDEKPRHTVRLESFFMAQTPITQAQWREVAVWKEREGERWGKELKANPSYFQTGEGKGGVGARLLKGAASTDERPVEQVSWEDAMEFCSRLSQRTGRTYTLPSEAQWEYACRAGTKTPFAFGHTLTAELANYQATKTYANGPKGEFRGQTTPVGMFPANAWGLYDMHGNVWEWCLDHWHGSYGDEGVPTDGSAWMNKDEKGGTRLLRGGSWNSLPGYCRSAYRYHAPPVYAINLVGFRVVCLPQGPSLSP